MDKSIAILINQLRILFRARLWLFFTIAAPLMFVLVLGLAQGGNALQNYDARVPVIFVVQDSNPVAMEVVNQALQSKVIVPATGAEGRPYTGDEAQARRDVQQRVVAAAVFIPSGLDATLLSGQPAQVTFLVTPGSSTSIAVEQELRAILGRVSASYDAARAATEQAAQVKPFASEAERTQYYDAALAEARRRVAQPSVTTNTIQSQATIAASEQVAHGFNQSAAGSLVQWLMTGAFSTAGAIVAERRRGTLRRLMVMPTTRAQILSGNLLLAFCVALLQAVTIIVFGGLLGTQWGHDIPALAVTVLCYALAMSGLAMLFAALVRTDNQAIGLGIAIANIAAPLAGAWFPRELLPATMVTVGKLLPSGWAMEALIGVIVHHYHLADVLLPCAVMLAFGAAFLGAGILRFRFE